MVKDVESLRRELIALGIAAPGDLQGASSPELDALEQRWGVQLPKVYREIMSVVGKKAGALTDEEELWFYLDQLDHMNGFVREWHEDAVNTGELPLKLPEKAFFFCSRYLENPCFIIGDGGDDSIVYIYRDALSPHVIAVLHDSLWAWLDALVRDAAWRVTLPGTPSHSRRG